MPPSRSGTVLKKKWRLGALVGTGGCAEVYEATDLRGESAGGGQLVAKIAPLPVGLPPAMSKGKKRKKTDQEKHADMIYYEYTLYKGFLLDHKGVVEIPAGGYGEDQNLRYLVMTRLGPDVEAAQSLTGPWSVARTAGYARQMLNLLRSLHEKSKMVFVDVKPENFMFGLPGSADEDKIFIIDFGLSSRYTGPAGSIKPQSISGQVQGTPEYLSLKCHGGASAGRCDDLESLGYVVLFLLNGGVSPLPWSGSTSVASGLATKRSTSLEALCEGCPLPMLQYMKTVRGMAYEDTPDYDALEAMLQSMQKAGGGAAKAPAGGRAAGRGAAASTANMNTSSSKGAKGKSKATPDVEVCEVSPVPGKPKAQKSTKAAPTSTTSPERPAARRSGRLISSKECASPAPPSASRRKVAGGRPRQLTIESPSKTAVDGEDFFDARQEPSTTKEEQEDVLEVTKVVSGAGKSGRNEPGGTGASNRSASRRAAAAKQEFVLEVVAGPHKGETVRLTAGGAEVRVGRNAPRKNGLRLDNDFEVSDKHAVLRPQPDGIHCEDVGSLNGSFVNEDRLEDPVVLEDGDVLQVGQSIVKISC